VHLAAFCWLKLRSEDKALFRGRSANGCFMHLSTAIYAFSVYFSETR
jgi:hypothetical protein